MAPRVAVKRMPSSAATSMVSSSRQPLGNRYKWSELVEQPESISSAMATRVATRSMSGVILPQTGYSACSHANSSASCAAGKARVRLWYMW